MRLQTVATFVADALFPHFCAGCGAEGAVLCLSCRVTNESPQAGIFECPGCGKETPFGRRCDRRACAAQTALDGVAHALPYARPVPRRLLHSYKYDRVDAAGGELASMFGAFVRVHAAAFRAVSEGAIVVAAPMHPWKEAWRGFNQSQMLAEVYARILGARLESSVLGRTFGMQRQALLPHDRAVRGRNLEGRIRVERTFPRGARFTVIDDVCTTGATLDACARALKAAGAGEVRAVTLLKG